MITQAQTLYETAKANHDAFYKQILELRELTSKQGDIKELADIAFAVYEAHKLIDDMEKEVRLLGDKLNQIVAAMWVQSCPDGPIKTPYTTVTPRVKVMARVPSIKADGVEKFNAFLKAIGMPDHLVHVHEEDQPPMKPYWPGMVDYISRLAIEGKPLPDGIDTTKTYNLYTCRFYKRKEPNAVLEESK